MEIPAQNGSKIGKHVSNHADPEAGSRSPATKSLLAVFSGYAREFWHELPILTAFEEMRKPNDELFTFGSKCIIAATNGRSFSQRVLTKIGGH